MNFALNEMQDAMRRTARDFASREISPFATEWDRRERMDRTVIDKLASIGFLGATIPCEYGGVGVDNLSYCLIIEELGRSDSSVRGIVSVNNSLVAKPILFWGTEEQKQAWLPRLASGNSLGCFGLTEPGAGSNPAELVTGARWDGNEWIITGNKIFISNGKWADLALIFARTEGEDSSPRGISCFLVATDAPGFSATEMHGKLGLRAQSTAELILKQVRVPSSALLGEEGQGLQVAMTALDSGRISVAAGSVGVAEACLDASLGYSKARRQFGRPIAGFQLIQELIADMAVETQAARLLTWHAATLADEGRPHRLQSTYAKYFASEAAIRAANAALQVHGGYGYMDDYPVQKYLRDARVTSLYEGTSQIQKLVIGRELTGQNAFT